MRSTVSTRTACAILTAVGAAAYAGPSGPCPAWDLAVGTPGAQGGSVSGVERIGDEVFIGGGYTTLDGAATIQRWGRYNLVTNTFLPLGDSTPDNFVTGFFTYDDGTGQQVYITGSFNTVTVDGNILPNSRGLVRWDGNTVSTVPGSPLTGIFDFMFDGIVYNNMLVVGGSGGTAAGQKPTLAMWDGINWTKISNEFAGPVAPVIIALAEFQGDLYIGGRFATFDADLNDPGNPLVESNNIIRFDGTAFSSVGGGVFRASSVISQVLALKVFNDGSGEKLYVGGRFDRLGSNTGLVSPAVARWDGSTWETLPGFPQNGREVRAFEVFNNELYAVGNFENTGDGTVVCRKFARWTGSEWTEVGGGFAGAAADQNPSTMTATNRGLFIGGSFTSAGNSVGPNAGPANGIVQWIAACVSDCPADVDGSSSVDLLDLNIVLANFGATTTNGDTDGNGVVDLLDLNAILAAFGSDCL